MKFDVDYDYISKNEILLNPKTISLGQKKTFFANSDRKIFFSKTHHLSPISTRGAESSSCAPARGEGEFFEKLHYPGKFWKVVTLGKFWKTATLGKFWRKLLEGETLLFSWLTCYALHLLKMQFIRSIVFCNGIYAIFFRFALCLSCYVYFSVLLLLLAYVFFFPVILYRQVFSLGKSKSNGLSCAYI